MWLGASVEDQQQADLRIPPLLAVPAAVRVLSLEPLLGPVDLWSARYRLPGGGLGSAFNWGNGIGWVIVGGESGPNGRPMHLRWVEQLRAECREANVPFFFKQWGRWWPISQLPAGLHERLYMPKRPHGSNPNLSDEQAHDLYGSRCLVATTNITSEGQLYGPTSTGPHHLSFDLRRFPQPAELLHGEAHLAKPLL